MNPKIKNSTKKRKAFSVLETLVVVSVISIIATIGWTVALDSKRIPLERQVWRQIERSVVACYLYFENTGDFPAVPVKTNLLASGLMSNVEEFPEYVLHMDRDGDVIHIYVPKDQSSPNVLEPKKDWRGVSMIVSVEELTFP